VQLTASAGEIEIPRISGNAENATINLTALIDFPLGFLHGQIILTWRIDGAQNHGTRSQD
jgi:hypothetical protein